LNVWRQLASFPFLNAGSILGDLPSILALLENMVRECRQVQSAQGDQAVLNYIVHRRLVPATVHPFGEGAVINLHAVQVNSLRIVEGRLVDAENRAIPVVHQYDRVTGLAEKLSAVRGQ